MKIRKNYRHAIYKEMLERHERDILFCEKTAARLDGFCTLLVDSFDGLELYDTATDNIEDYPELIAHAKTTMYWFDTHYENRQRHHILVKAIEDTKPTKRKAKS